MSRFELYHSYNIGELRLIGERSVIPQSLAAITQNRFMVIRNTERN